MGNKHSGFHGHVGLLGHQGGSLRAMFDPRTRGPIEDRGGNGKMNALKMTTVPALELPQRIHGVTHQMPSLLSEEDIDKVLNGLLALPIEAAIGARSTEALRLEFSEVDARAMRRFILSIQRKVRKEDPRFMTRGLVVSSMQEPPEKKTNKFEAMERTVFFYLLKAA